MLFADAVDVDSWGSAVPASIFVVGIIMLAEALFGISRKLLVKSSDRSKDDDWANWGLDLSFGFVLVYFGEMPSTKGQAISTTLGAILAWLTFKLIERFVLDPLVERRKDRKDN